LFASTTPPIAGGVRDRDVRDFRRLRFNVHEAQLVAGDPSSWRQWLYDFQTNTVSPLNVRTHGNSPSIGIPTVTDVTNPDGSGRLIITYYVHPQGAAPGEAGELIFYRDYDPTVVAAGDISSNGFGGQQRTANLIKANPTTAVLTLGDNQYETGTLTNFNTYYGSTWGLFKSYTYPSPGNHDRCVTSGYDEYFGKPCWYSFDLGQWHLISLDSNTASDAAQLAFLDQDLASTTKPCVLAFWHHPRFSSGGVHGNDTRTAGFWTRLYNANADLVLTGHDHIYERFAPQTPSAVRNDVRGIRSFVVGTGGKSLYGIGTIRANSEVRHVSGYGVLRMTLRPNGYDWRYESETGNAFTDAGSGSCH
jgi:Calcineurin-like phosphoesterase